ncbi:hypothetical protein [Kitasatospora viridis]|uniref:Fibronectin type-III domain-containing protein n=1 Tax=Kitasatospora viridis TaxID=281105 RepID=A0A561S9W0_9ACTN|nr:hypothetical protein [Kitasatospora viridis]TWF71660.1 hypothetical protein FHX73_1831 [Kitasatospora viridis]
MASGDVTSTLDTEGVAGKTGPRVTTADTSGAVVETDGAIGTRGQAPTGPVPASFVDTTGVARVAAAPGGWKPSSTAVTGQRETTLGTVVDVQQKYQKPNAAGVPGSVLDTTRTDLKTTDGQGATRPDPNAPPVTGTVETLSIGAVPKGSVLVPAAPAAPTLAGADRAIVVTWVAVADPAADAPVLRYEIESDTGGHADAGRNATALRFTQVVGGRGYLFRARAENRNGTGPWSPWSASGAVATNSDEVAAGGLTAANAVNPIYRQDGTVVPGSWGAPTLPGQPTVAPQGTAGTATVSWAPSTPAPAGGYDVTASSGQTIHVGSAVVSANVPGLTVAAQVTFTVKAIGALQNALSAPSASYTVA